MPKCEDGQKLKIFMDECKCPMLKCFGCSNERPINVALLLDSSSSMKDYWKDMVNEIKSEFIPSIMTAKSSCMSISKFGDNYENIAGWSTETRGYSLDGHTEFVDMNPSATATAMRKVFDLLTSKEDLLPKADKFLIVFTDDPPRDKAAIRAIAKKWSEKAKVIVMGFGDIDKAGLLQVANNIEGNVFLMPNFEDFKTAMLRLLVPAVCGKAPIPMFSGVGNGI